MQIIQKRHRPYRTSLGLASAAIGTVGLLNQTTAHAEEVETSQDLPREDVSIEQPDLVQMPEASSDAGEQDVEETSDEKESLQEDVRVDEVSNDSEEQQDVEETSDEKESLQEDVIIDEAISDVEEQQDEKETSDEKESLEDDVPADQPALLTRQATATALRSARSAGNQQDVKETPYEKDISTTYKKQTGQLKPSVTISGDQYSEAKPREYIFVVDRSNSLNNDQTIYADKLVNAIIDTMGPKDRGSIVYGGLNNMVSLANFFGLDYKNYVESVYANEFRISWTKEFRLGTSLTSNKETLRNNLKQNKNFLTDNMNYRWSGSFQKDTVKSLVYISDEGVMTDFSSTGYLGKYKFKDEGKAYERALADIAKKFNLDTIIPITMDEYIDHRNPFRENNYQVLDLPNYKQNPTQADVDKVVNRTLKETKITTYKPITVKATVQGDTTQFKSAKVTGPNGFSKTLTLSGDKKSLNTTFTPTADGNYQLVVDYESQPKNGGAKVEAGFYQGSKALKSDSHTISTIKTAVKEVKKVKSFTTTTKDDPTLPKGKQVVERYGRDGYVIEEITTNTTQGFGQTAKSTNNSKTKQTVAMVPKIIRVGSREYTYKEVKETQSVPFKTIRQNDDTLDKGQEKIVQKGVNGENTLTYKVTLKNGKEEKKELLSTVQTKKPIDQIIKVGTKVTLVKEVKETQSVPFKTIRENDDTLDKGQEKIVQRGVNGVNTLTYQVTTVNGKQTDKKLVSTVETTKPVDQIIKVGTMVTQVKNMTETQSVPFKTLKENDPNLESGQEKVVQRGAEGLNTLTYEITIVNGKQTDKKLVSTVLTTKPIDQIIKVGTMVTTHKEESKETPIAFKEHVIRDSNVDPKDSRIEVKGVDGVETSYYKVTYKNGKEAHRELLNKKITKRPIDQIRLVGTRITEVKTETAKEAVPFKTLYQEDPTLKLGEKKVDQEGVEGEKTLTYEVTYINRAKDHQKLIKEVITKKPVDRIIKVGLLEHKTMTENHPLPFKTRYIDNTALPKGEEKVLVDGQEGLEQWHYDTQVVNGKEVKRTLNRKEVFRTPIDRVIHRGVLEKTQEVVPEEVGYKTKYVDDATLPLGQEKVVQKGQAGLINHHYTVLSAKGEVIERKLDRHKTVREAQDEIIHRGVLETRQETDTKAVPYQIKRVKNPDLEAGQTRIKVKGQNGLDQLTYENQYVHGKLVKSQLISTTRQVEPVDEVIEEGTKETVIKTVQTTKKLPYTSIVEKDDTLPKGVRKVVVEGKEGTLYETYEVTIVNGQEVSRKVIESHQEDPINEVIHIGTKEEVTPLPGQPVLPQTGDASLLTTLLGQGMLLSGAAMVRRKKRD